MKRLICGLILVANTPLVVFAAKKNNVETIKKQITHIVNQMSLQQKIGQKLMLDIRYWCPKSNVDSSCTSDFTQMNPTVAHFIHQYNIGSLIIFKNNAHSLQQIRQLTKAAQKATGTSAKLLISTDEEGGIVDRLPKSQVNSFSGNMAIGAASLGNKHTHFAYRIGNALGQQLKSVGINADNAPDVDVNVNPQNPVINVRSFSDDPAIVAKLGAEMTAGLQQQGIAATLKHFPGHGDTKTDSHTGLPIVNHSKKEAWAIDLMPFKKIIQQQSPDMIMTAHIQYPALDDSKIYADKIDKNILVPATLSIKIQTDILRNQLHFKGISISDALDMGAIAENFTPATATIDTYKAGVDIALMPIEIHRPKDIAKFKHFIHAVELAVKKGKISINSLNQSIERILLLKAKLGLLKNTKINHKRNHQLQTQLANNSSTLVQNKHYHGKPLLPIHLHPKEKIHILTPWPEQAAAITHEINALQKQGRLPRALEITTQQMSNTTLTTERSAVDKANVVIVADIAMTSSPIHKKSAKTPITQRKKTKKELTIPVADQETLMNINKRHHTGKLFSSDGVDDSQFAYDILDYAHDTDKATILVSTLSPYDLPNYKVVADAMLASYDYYGYRQRPNGTGYLQGPAMSAITRAIFGIDPPTGKLPVNVPNPNDINKISYPRGFGLCNYKPCHFLS